MATCAKCGGSKLTEHHCPRCGAWVNVEDSHVSGPIATGDIDKLVTDALIEIEKRKREFFVAEGRLQDAEHAYNVLRERQRKEKPTLGDLVEQDARRPVR